MKKSLLKILIFISALTFSNSVWGNSVSSTSGHHDEDIQNGKVVLQDAHNHATFTLSGMDIKYHERFGAQQIDAYDLGAVAWKSSDYVTLNWTVEEGYEIKVTRIAFWARAYTSSNSRKNDGEVVFDGVTKTAGTIWVLENINEWAKFDVTKSGGFTSGTQIECKNALTSYLSYGYTYDYMIKNLVIEYTITPIINTKNGSVEVTICEDNKHTLDLNSCLTNKKSHLSYLFTCTDADAEIVGTSFSATRVGSYTVTVLAGKETNCHESKTTSFTVNVTPAALSLTAPTASDIIYPATLASSSLTGGSAMVGTCEVGGTWAWQTPSTCPSVGDNQPFPVVFTPSANAGNYTNFITNAMVNVLAYIFTGEGDDDEKANIWAKDDNWNVNNTPTIENVVIIRHDVIVEDEVFAYSVEIETGYSLTIAPTGGLTVGAGGISGATKDNLFLKAGTSGVEKGQTGYLRISPDYAGAMPEATVELFSVSYYDQAAGADNSAVWQGVGSPISETGVLAKSVYTSCWVYSWDETTDGWVNHRATLELTPFIGFSTTQKKEPEGRKYTYEGHLVSGAAPVTMDLAYTEGHGTNLLANSWAAPISIPNFESSDFVNAAQTIYILNAGTKTQSDANEGGFTAPGKYIGVPIQTASELAASGYPVVIPSMQGFWVQAEGASAQLRLDYSRLVWGADYSGDGSNQPLRAPKHNAEASPVTGKMKVSISAGGWSDFIFLLESEKYMPEYEDGYDAIKIPSGGMDLFTVEGENYLGVDATNSIIGTRVGVRTSEETAYTLSFSHLKSESDMSLWDLEADQKIEINEGTTYTFFAEPNAEITDRFLIIERAGAPTNTTGVDDAEDEANVHKFIIDNQLYILKNGVLYNGTGARVK